MFPPVFVTLDLVLHGDEVVPARVQVDQIVSYWPNASDTLGRPRTAIKIVDEGVSDVVATPAQIDEAIVTAIRDVACILDDVRRRL